MEELKINPPSYRLPRSRDKWIYLDVHTQEDKKKVLDTIGEKYTFEGRELTVKVREALTLLLPYFFSPSLYFCFCKSLESRPVST